MNKNQERGRTMPRRWLQRGTLATLAAIIGVVALSASPALADRKKDKWKHHNHGHYQQHHHYYHDDPRVVYVQPRTVYVEEPVYYVVPRHHPRPIVYERPAINIVVPLFD